MCSYILRLVKCCQILLKTKKSIHFIEIQDTSFGRGALALSTPIKCPEVSTFQIHFRMGVFVNYLNYMRLSRLVTNSYVLQKSVPGMKMADGIFPISVHLACVWKHKHEPYVHLLSW
jgi:hypothetical protein